MERQLDSTSRENETLTSEMDAILVENAQLREQVSSLPANRF